MYNKNIVKIQFKNLNKLHENKDYEKLNEKRNEILSLNNDKILRKYFYENLKIMKKEITYKKHLDILYKIEYTLNSDNKENDERFFNNEFNFVENVINSFSFNFNENDSLLINNELIEKIDIENDFENDFEIIKNVFKKVLNLICKIFKENEFDFKFEII